MKTPGFLKQAVEALNPKEWVKGAAESIGGEVRAGIDENTYSQEESAANSNTRHALDMASDSIASKTVRPFAFYAFFTLIMILIFTSIKIEPWAQDLIKTSFYMILGWYFGERGIIKILREVKKPKK